MVHPSLRDFMKNSKFISMCKVSEEEQYHGFGVLRFFFFIERSSSRHVSEPILKLGGTPWTFSCHPKILRNLK